MQKGCRGRVRRSAPGIGQGSGIQGARSAGDLQQMTEGRIAYNNGALIQKAFPFLNADQREFLMSGLTPDEWNAIFA
jgi:hypothetical protein